MVFARGLSDPLTGLVKKIDAATRQNASARMGSFVVVCTDDSALPDRLRDLAKKEKIESTILATFDRGGPDGYDVAAEADITVVLYVKKTVKVNRAFRDGEMKESDVKAILADLSKILPTPGKEK